MRKLLGIKKNRAMRGGHLNRKTLTNYEKQCASQPDSFVGKSGSDRAHSHSDTNLERLRQSLANMKFDTTKKKKYITF